MRASGLPVAGGERTRCTQNFEQRIVAKVTSAAPPLYHDQKDQFVRTLPGWRCRRWACRPAGRLDFGRDCPDWLARGFGRAGGGIPLTYFLFVFLLPFSGAHRSCRCATGGGAAGALRAGVAPGRSVPC